MYNHCIYNFSKSKTVINYFYVNDMVVSFGVIFFILSGQLMKKGINLIVHAVSIWHGAVIQILSRGQCYHS